MTKPEQAAPYELFEGNVGGFLILKFQKSSIALPYIGLRQIAHQHEPERIVMEFAEQSIEVHGKGLGQLFEMLATLRVKILRVGADEKGGCRIEKLVPLEG